MSNLPIQGKCNTTSTMYVDQTITAPNMKSLIKSMSLVILQQIHDDQTRKLKIKNNNLKVFDEEKYISEKPDEFSKDRIKILRQMPTQDHIYEFIYAVYKLADFSQ